MNSNMLTVYPGVGASSGSESSPWNAYRDHISSVVFAGEDGGSVVAPANSRNLLSGLTRLASVDLSGLDTSSVTDMSYMFRNCSSLTSLDLSPLDTSSVTSMSFMFSGCSSLASLDLSPLDTSSVTSMSYMFYGCSSLASLDLSGWDTSSVTHMSYMFYDCSSLESICVGGAWSTDKVTSSSDMFSGCASLVGGMGTQYSSGYTDKERARIDRPGSPGYLTLSSRFDISGATVTVADQTYMGGALTPSPTIVLGGETLVSGKDYEVSYSGNVDAGTATVTVTGRGNYAGSISSSFEIIPASISGASVSPINAQTYTGTSLTPAPTVTLGGRTLSRGTDYEVSYSGNVDAGTATVTVTGRGNYAGTITAAFEIAPAALSGASVSPIADQTYTGGALAPSPTVTLGGRTLDEGTDFEVSYSGNVDAGTATVTVAGRGNYAGTITAAFEIAPRDVADVSVAPIPDQVWTGSAIEPVISASFSGARLEEGSDYEVSYSDNVDAGTATVTVAGRGNYAGTVTAAFEIAPKGIAGASIAPIASQTYTGSAIEPGVTVTMDGAVLETGTDYEVSYSGNVDAGTATVTITGRGNYAGSTSSEFAIAPAPISNASVTVEGQTYTGAELTPAPTVRLGGKTLDEGTDYEVSYSDNKNRGTATVTVAGRGNYTGEAYSEFQIAPRSVSDVSVAPIPDQAWTGSAVEPGISVSFTNAELREGIDYAVEYSDNVALGAATVTVTGMGNFVGSRTEGFEIVPRSIVGAFVTVSSQTYTGVALTPALTVRLGGKTLARGTDYDVSYSGNVDAGTASVTVTGRGNYAGSISSSFEITPASISGASVAVAGQTYTGGALAPSPVVTLGGRTLTGGTDYTVSYSNNTNVGTATVTVTGRGNYAGTKAASFDITPAALSGASVTVGSRTYTGGALTPSPVVMLGGRTLTGGTDYTVSYSDNTNAGTARVTVTGRGNYAGSASGSFTISRAPLSYCTVSVAAGPHYYDGGRQVKPAVTLTRSGKALSQGTDYTVSYRNNTELGTATVTISGAGNYTGTLTRSFTIGRRPLEGCEVTVTPASLGYTGKPLTPEVAVTIGGRELVLGTDYEVSYANNANPGTATVTVTGVGGYSGTATATFEITAPDVKLIPIYRMYNTKTSEHLWTKSKAEYNSCGSGNYRDWRQENVAWYSPNLPTPASYAASTQGDFVYVYRLYDKGRTGDHIYLTYGSEMKTYLGNGWVVDKGAGFWTMKKGKTYPGRTTIPIYRAYNPKLSRGKHHYTPSKTEYTSITTKNGWTPEGTKFYVVKK